MYDELKKHFKKGFGETVGLSSRPFRSWKDYFLDLLGRPGHLLTVDGKIVEVLDSAPLIQILSERRPVRVRDLPRTHFENEAAKKEYEKNRVHEVILDANDIELTQAICWRDCRLKFSFKPEVDTRAFVRALRSSAVVFENFLEKNFTNAYVEIRPVSLQQPHDFLALPAFTFGLMHDVQSVEAITRRYSWNFWRDMRVAGYKHGMSAVVDGVSVVEFLDPLYTVAHNALRSRGKNEEALLAPLRYYIDHKQTPADCAEKVYSAQGKKAFLDALTFTPQKI